MARTYTYDDFKKALAASGLSGQFSDADLKLAERDPDAGMSILSYKQDYNNATTDEARALANAGANAIRSSFGEYTAGENGGGYYKTQASPNSFEYTAPAPEYKNTYGQQVDKTLTELLDRKEFTYDPETDPLYSSYKKTYTREGKRATADTLGSVAAATGGIPSSYAVTAANQAGNYYASQLADKVPELYDMAYNKYLQEYQMKLNDLEALEGREQFEYSRYMDELSQYENDKNFNYAQWLDELQSQANERSEALSKAYAAAEYGDFSYLESLGITPDFELLAALGNNGGGTTGGTVEPPAEPPEDTELQEAVKLVKQTYPDGVVTDESTWNMLVSQFGEDAVIAAGLTYKKPNDGPGTSPENTWTQTQINDVAANVSALVEMMKGGDADIKTKDDVEAAIYAAYPQYANDAYFALLVEEIISSLTKEASGGRGVGGPGGKLERKDMSK